jgi:2-polyprenyl-6-methoxyphenol hydroxylase-like FAD-dependent oxidoreductase
MYPIGSNGASQAVIDGRVLAWELARRRDPMEALAAYDADRRETTSALVFANRQMGPEKVLRIVAERAPEGFDRIEDAMSAAELEAIARDYKVTAGFDVEALNDRLSWDVVVKPGSCLPHQLSFRTRR